MPRTGLGENAQCRAGELDRARDHPQGDQDTDDDVCPGPSEHDHQHAGDEHPDAADRIGQNLHVRTADGQGILGVAANEQHDDDIGRETGCRSENQRNTGDFGSVADARDRLVHDERRNTEQQNGIGDGGQHFRPMPAESPCRCGTSLAGEHECDQAHRHAEHIGEHVARIGEQAERADRHGDGRLDDEKHHQDREGDDHLANAGPGWPRTRRRVSAHAVAVPVTRAHDSPS